MTQPKPVPTGVRVTFPEGGEKIIMQGRSFHFDGYNALIITGESGSYVARYGPGKFDEVEVTFE
jgi:hypothetical protein